METLTLVRSKSDRKNQRLVVYNIEGRTGSVQFLSTLFGGTQTSQGKPPDKLTLSGEFAAPRPKETPEQRKARLAAITPAERLARMEARVAKMKATLAASTSAAAPTTSAAAPPAPAKSAATPATSAKGRR